MTFMINWIAPKFGGQPKTAIRDGLTVGASRNSAGRWRSYVILTEALMWERHITIGSRCLVGDAGSHIAVKPVSEGGYALCATGARKTAAAVMVPGDLVKRMRRYSRDELTFLADGTILIPKFAPTR